MTTRGTIRMLALTCAFGWAGCDTTDDADGEVGGDGAAGDAADPGAMDGGPDGAEDGGPPGADRGVEGDGGGPVEVEPCISIVRVGGVEIFAFEASRPDATGDGAGVDESAVCSRAGVLPWTRLTRPDASRVCLANGFRLCTDEEWQTACQGPERLWSFPYAQGHRMGVCNDHVSGSGALEPTGIREGCRTPDGVYDMSGNVWELTAEGSKRGASWKLNAVMFRIDAARCDMYYALAEAFADDDVGFRCCRD